MNGPNFNYVLAAVVAVILIAAGALVAVFMGGGSSADILARAAVITALVAPTVTSLLVLLQGSRTSDKVVKVSQQLNGHSDALTQTTERVDKLEEAAQVTPGPKGPRVA